MPDQKTDDAARGIKPGAILRAMKESRAAELPALGAGDPGGEPELTVHRVDGRVRRITAVCTCGRKIEIHCDY